MKKFVFALLALAFIRVDVAAVPLYRVIDTANESLYLSYDAHRDLFLDTSLRTEYWCLNGRNNPDGNRCWDPVEIPAKKKLVFSLRMDLVREEQWQFAAASALVGAKPPVRRRFVGINAEHFEWPEQSRVWPHLGLLYVGTTAEQAGYEVVLWDEWIQGKAPLEKLIQPGDIVGLSLVTTGIERGVELAHRCKALGARCVVAGNDSAIFRARQLLSLPGKPIDAVFTSNSVVAIGRFLREVTRTPVEHMRIPHVAVRPHDTRAATLASGSVTAEAKEFDTSDYFMVPNLRLFGPEYWDLVWSAYRSQFGHKHRSPSEVRNAVALLAQGCGRAGVGEKCDYCSIGHVENVLIPGPRYLEQTLETYHAFGINTFFNVTDSAFEMGPLVRQLKAVGSVDSLVIYGRAQAIARQPGRLDEWLDVARHRLLINCGMDSADEQILQQGIRKSSSKIGSRVDENRQAIRIIKAAGDRAHLHYSLIFGAVGETRDSCEANLELLQWSIDTLGSQLDVVEGDVFWVNFGAPCSAIFCSYEEASRRAALAGKTISKEQWHTHFAQYADALAVPQSCEESWYHFFTNITYETARAYNAQVQTMMERVPGRITGREFAFKPPA